ncbi:hypothetical protein PS880_04331 [Pseudomonas fluorescens]|uniref:Uncharacterized protein n=2 Tax=Pseudomonas fluorescens TaxID=294 RepID=A0A5E7N1U0_PSEFL|nr:hypothetical protein PS880_04331 [Pseudomonas fluorescens]
MRPEGSYFPHRPALLKFLYGCLCNITQVLSKRTWSPLMNTLFQLAFSARADWALGVLLSREADGKVSAEMKFQEARDRAWAYGWGASSEPSPFFSDVPDLLNAFHAGAQTLALDCNRCSLESTI